MKKLFFLVVIFAVSGFNEAIGQWTTSGNNIYNTNTGNVGIGNNAPSTLLFVAKNMTEPTITVRNLGGFGGATYAMTDDASGADWKFKATLSGGFKIRDHANLMDVITIEPNSFANAIYIKTTDNMGIGTATPASSALVDISSVNKGFLLPRMTTQQRDAIQNPVDGLLVFNLTTGCLDYYFAGIWKSFCECPDSEFQCGWNITINHAAGSVAPVSKTVTYGTVTNIPGETSKCWITSNLGADHQATAVDDTTEESAGWYWQFNRKQGYKHTGSARTPNTTWITSIDENSDWLITNDPCALLLGTGWRLPTSTEWTNVDASGGWTNWNGPWNSALKMHAAGYLESYGGSLFSKGYSGFYWSSTQVDHNSGRLLIFDNGFCGMSYSTKADGYSGRCLRD
jgi:hypothetical protein